MIRVPALVLLSATALSIAAHADSTDTFSFTGTDASNNPYTIDFSVNPANYTSPYGGFMYSDASGSVDGVSDTFVVKFQPDTFDPGSEFVTLYDSGTFSAAFETDSNFLAGDPSSGNPPTVTSGSYSTLFECTASLRAPSVGTGLPASVAFFQVPSVTINCGATGDLSVNPTSNSVTPEPATLGLSAIGALGMVGVLRRRLRS